MTVCPWCKAKNPSGTQACIRCGKRATDHPSVAGRTVGDDFGDEIPTGPALDLDLGTHRSAQQVSAPLGRTVGGDDDWDEAPKEAPALDLDFGGDLPGPGDAMPSARLVAAPASSRVAIPKPDAPPASQRGGVAKPEPGAAIEIDTYEVRALADYGPDPKSIVESVPYAVRVLLRQRELRRALAAVRVALTEAEARRDERLVELGRVLQPVIVGNPEYAGFARSLSSAQKAMEDREGALAQTNAAYRERVAAIDAELAGLDAPTAAARRDLDAKSKAFDDAELLRKKHEARRKRVEIDVRAAQTKLAAPETPPPERAQAEALIAAAAQERETRAAEEKIAVAAARDAEAKVAEARRALASVEGKVEELRRRRKDVEKEFARQGAVRSEGVDAASKEVRAQLLEIGRRTRNGGPDAPGAEAARRSVSDVESQVKRLQVDLEKHVRALAAADRNAVRNGLVVLGAAIGIVLVAFVAWRALRSNPYLPSDQQPKSAIEAPRPFG